MWYTVRIDRSGLELSLDDEPDGVDVDIHLLRTDAGDSCMARGHTRVYAAVEPGTYQVVADTYVRDGAERPGPFTLRGTLRP